MNLCLPFSKAPAPNHEQQKTATMLPFRQGWLSPQGPAKTSRLSPLAAADSFQFFQLFLSLPPLHLIFPFPLSQITLLQSTQARRLPLSWDLAVLLLLPISNPVCRINKVILRMGSRGLGQISILQRVSFHSTRGLLNVNQHFSPGALLHSLQSTSRGGTFHWNPMERLLLFSLFSLQISFWI